ncbi:MAG: hypothetical protein DCC75_09275 [Proteobacteria bacterium]|nr:MAG: hypothetical protein DCC75_09275 [Pseudomonadota bacterium]
MSQLAYEAKGPTLTVIEGGKAAARAVSEEFSFEIIFLTAAMCLLQILDGMLTAIGVGHLGTEAEGNALLRYAMEEIGHINALFLIKGLAICVVLSLAYLSLKVGWVTKALRFMVVLYLLVAIIPWTAIIFLQVL